MPRVPVLLLISLLATVLNAVVFHVALIGLFALAAWVIAAGGLFGKAALPRSNALAAHSVGALVALALLAQGGAALYYVLPVTTAGLLLVLLSVSALGVFAARGKGEFTTLRVAPTALDGSILALGIAGLAGWWAAVTPIAIDSAVRTPWAVVPPVAVLALGVVGAAVMLAAIRGRRALAALLGSAALFSVAALAAAVYPLGFGFDPFLHRATVSHILEFGTITPKPLYYVGQYALELAAVKLFALPLALFDVLLAPALLALAAFAAAFALPRTLTAATLFLLPLAGFIPTTPQALGYIWAFLAIVAALAPDAATSKSAWLPWLFGIAALATHPIAGIPVMIFLAVDNLLRFRRRVALGVLIALGSCALPAVFLVQAAVFGLDATWSPTFDVANLPLVGFFGTGYDTFLDALYLVLGNALWICLILAILGSWKRQLTPTERALWLSTGMLAVNFVVLALGIDFAFLISYERNDFAARILTVMTLFLVPLAGLAIERAMTRLTSLPPSSVVLAASLVGLVAAASAYGAYPRHDGYARSAGFNVTQTDIDAVHAIQRREGDVDYVVLANQAVSAAAVQEFGFRKYYSGDVFYYPIPTGGPLYDVYLAMVDEAATKDNALRAMNLALVDTAYFVVNDYWWQSDAVIAQAKREANDWFALGDGDVTVFVFTRE